MGPRARHPVEVREAVTEPGGRRAVGLLNPRSPGLHQGNKRFLVFQREVADAFVFHFGDTPLRQPTGAVSTSDIDGTPAIFPEDRGGPYRRRAIL